MEKEIAKLNIFNSIFESTRYTGFEGLKAPLELIEIDNSLIGRFYDIDNNSDYIYLNSFKSTPINYTLELAGISSNFGVQEQKEWFKSYIANPNKFVLYVLSSYASKLAMNDKLKNKLDEEFLSCIYDSIELSAADINTDVENKYNESFSSEEFQDLVFITFAETVYNPEIEDELNTRFAESNPTFWNRFYELYTTVFKKKYGESKIFNDSFFFNEYIQKEKDRLGFEMLEDALSDSKYPIYPSEFLPYLTLQDETYKKKVDNPEYIRFRQREFDLYNELCNKYGITPSRSKMI